MAKDQTNKKVIEALKSMRTNLDFMIVDLGGETSPDIYNPEDKVMHAKDSFMDIAMMLRDGRIEEAFKYAEKSAKELTAFLKKCN